MSTIRASVEQGKKSYKYNPIYLDSAEIKNGRLDFDIHRESAYVFADYENMIQLSWLPFPIPTPTRHATDIVLGPLEINGSLDIFVGNNMICLEFEADDVSADPDNQEITITGVKFTGVNLKPLE